MTTHHTLTQLKSMKLDGMARALEEQLALPAATELGFEERFGMLVDRECAWRDSRRLDRLLKLAKLKHPSASAWRTSTTAPAAASTSDSSPPSRAATGCALPRTCS
jgi:hypothetical protein